MSNLNVSTVNATQEKRTFNGVIFGNTEGKISKKGTQYVKTCVLVEQENGDRMFLNVSLFPQQADVVTFLNALVKNREVTVTGTYKSREYEGRDGQVKTAHDLLCNNIKVGGVREWKPETTNTTMDWIETPKATTSTKPIVTNDPKVYDGNNVDDITSELDF